MRSLVCSGLRWMSLAATLLPAAALAQGPATAPAGYAPSPAAAAATAPVPVSAVKPAPHTHKGLIRGRTVCANCAKKEQAAMVAQGPMTERIVACAHSKNGVCPSCQALLALPGAITVNAPAPGQPAEAPGRAVVSNTPAPAPAQGAVAAVYDPTSTPEPAPIGVMQANYAQNHGPAAGGAAAPSSVPTAASMQPGHAVAEQMGASPAPFQHKTTSSKNPRIIGHLLGITGIGTEYREQRAQRKSEAHASIPYNNEGTTVNEVPASVIYGRR